MLYLLEIYSLFLKLSIDLTKFNHLFAFYFYLISEAVEYENNPSDLFAVLSNDALTMISELNEQGFNKLSYQLKQNKRGRYSYRSKHRITLQCDTTTDGRKYSSKKTKKVYKNWDNCLGKIIKTHTLVVLSCQIGFKRNAQRYILDFRVWDKKSGKTYSDYMLEMITALKERLEEAGCDLSLLVLTFDSSFSWLANLEKLQLQSIPFVGKFHHREQLKVNGKKVLITNWLSGRFCSQDFNEINGRYLPYVSHWEYYQWFFLDDYPELKLLLLLGKPNRKHKRSRLLLVTNLIGNPYYKALERWLCRWAIETIFQEENQSLAWSDYRRHSSGKMFTNYIACCCIKYNVLMDYRKNHRLIKFGIKRILRKIRLELAEYRLSELINYVSNWIRQDFFYDT